MSYLYLWLLNLVLMFLATFIGAHAFQLFYSDVPIIGTEKWSSVIRNVLLLSMVQPTVAVIFSSVSDGLSLTTSIYRFSRAEGALELLVLIVMQNILWKQMTRSEGSFQITILWFLRLLVLLIVLSQSTGT